MSSATTRILTGAGVAAPLAWGAAVIYFGASRPGYDAVNQFVSELAERGSSTESAMRIAGFYLPGLLAVIFALHVLFRSTAWRVVALLLVIHGVSRITAGAFPCDAGCPAPSGSVSQTLHNVAGMVNGFVVPAAAFVCGFGLAKAGRRRFATYSLLSAIAGMVFLLLMAMNLATRSHVGLFQRLSFGIMQVWLAAFALSLWPSRMEAAGPARLAAGSPEE